MKRALILPSAVLLAVLTSGTAYADDPEPTPPDGPVPIELVTVNGSGCKQGTARVTMSPDNTSFEVEYDDYVARVGGAASPVDFRKHCQLNLRIGAPPGYSYVIVGVRHHGWAQLAEGATGLVRNRYYIQGSSETATGDHRYTGPYEDDWVTEDSDVWLATPCGEQRNVNISSELRVRPGEDRSVPSLMTMATSGGDVRTKVRLAWRRC